MTSMIEIVGRLQKAIELLESSPDNEASVIFARQVLKDTEPFVDFSLVKERRKRIQEFLDSLIALDSEDDTESDEKLLDGVCQDVWERRESFAGINLYEEALRLKDEYDDLWIRGGDYVRLLGNYSSVWLMHKDMFDAVWMSCKVLSDMQSYYEGNCVGENDEELILQVVNVVEEILDGTLYGSEDRNELVRLYNDTIRFIDRRHVSELRFDERIMLPHKGKYNDEWLLDDALWQPYEMEDADGLQCWRITQDGKTIVSHFWPSVE